ncbi:hypothetical protein [Mycolicibacterium llatzerense]|uniref:hypothetical protein n=1 Tax=Mycolicibacterium llatzerense TaxID=280871 RepID=UPI0031D3675E
MRVVLSILFMGMLTFVAVLLMVAEAILKLLPLIVGVLLIWAAVRVAGRRRAASATASAPLRARPSAAVQPAVTRRVAAPPAGGWFMVPVWMGPNVAQPVVIDAEVIEQDGGPRV